ncbi:MAG: cell division protein SepF [Coriobacteriia bacterium]|nr:cell division protein SepF [Coriobacteriia bacterium]
MGILDSIKGRLPGNSNSKSGKNNYQEYDEYPQERDGYDESDMYDDEYAGQLSDESEVDDSSIGSSGGSRGSSSGSRFGNTRSYHNNTSVPLISMADVRSQELPPLDAKRTPQRSTIYSRNERAIASAREAASLNTGDDFGVSQTETMYTSPYYDDTPAVTAEVFAQSGTQTFAELHAARQRIGQRAEQPIDPRVGQSNGQALDSLVTTPLDSRTDQLSDPRRNPGIDPRVNQAIDPRVNQRAAQSLGQFDPRMNQIADPRINQRVGRNPDRVTSRVSASPVSMHGAASATNGRGPASVANSPAYYTSRSGPTIQRQTQQASQAFRQLAVIRPTTYADSEQVAVALRSGAAVAIDLTQVRAELAKRILDFSFGAAAALEAQVAGLSNRVYAITRDYALTDDERELLVARGVLR